MSFLKRLGQILAAGLQVTGVFFPVLRPFLGSGPIAQAAGTVVNDFTQVGTTVLMIETALQGKTGAEKLAAAAPLVAQIVKTSELVSGHQIGNEAEFVAGTQDLTNAVVRILNSLKSDKVQAAGQSLHVALSAPLAVPTQVGDPRFTGTVQPGPGEAAPSATPVPTKTGIQT